MNTKHLGLKLLLIGLVCFAALFNLETSPFRYLVPAAPFTDSPGGQLAGDTYVYLYTGGLIPKGLMPYRDFFDHKGPLVYIMMAAGIMIGKIAGVWRAKGTAENQRADAVEHRLSDGRPQRFP